MELSLTRSTLVSLGQLRPSWEPNGSHNKQGIQTLLAQRSGDFFGVPQCFFGVPEIGDVTNTEENHLYVIQLAGTKEEDLATNLRPLAFQFKIAHGDPAHAGSSLSVVFRRLVVVFEFDCAGGTSLVEADVNDSVLIELHFRTSGHHSRVHRPR
jgi:hypothetical protein